MYIVHKTKYYFCNCLLIICIKSYIYNGNSWSWWLKEALQQAVTEPEVGVPVIETQSWLGLVGHSCEASKIRC